MIEMKPAVSENLQPPDRHREQRDILWLLIKALGVVTILWLIFIQINSSLPYIGPGADVIYAAKEKFIIRQTLFRPKAQLRVVMFGNSKMLAGFIPKLFDSLSDDKVSSFNMGRPASLQFIEDLERICASGEPPTHVLLMFWPKDSPRKSFNIFHLGIDDSELMSTLFPFRQLPRNLTLFAIRAHSRGGLRAYYADCRHQTEEMLQEKGYYFIEGQSHFAGDRLPDSFQLQEDTPDKVFPRSVATKDLAFNRLLALKARFGFSVIFVPGYFRQGEYAVPSTHSDLAVTLAPYEGFSVVGPDYFLMPNRYFSDAVHLNKKGADVFTRRLWDLIGHMLFAGAPVDSTKPADLSSVR